MKKILYFWDLSHQKLVQCILNMLTDEKDAKHQAMVFKAKALTVLLFLSILCDWLDAGIRNYVLWAIGFQGMEIVGIILWKGRQRVLCVKN